MTLGGVAAFGEGRRWAGDANMQHSIKHSATPSAVAPVGHWAARLQRVWGVTGLPASQPRLQTAHLRLTSLLRRLPAASCFRGGVSVAQAPMGRKTTGIPHFPTRGSLVDEHVLVRLLGARKAPETVLGAECNLRMQLVSAPIPDTYSWSNLLTGVCLPNHGSIAAQPRARPGRLPKEVSGGGDEKPIFFSNIALCHVGLWTGAPKVSRRKSNAAPRGSLRVNSTRWTTDIN